MPKKTGFTTTSLHSRGFTTFIKTERGFTLIELLITISIIAILSAIGMVAYAAVLKQGRDSKRQSDLRSIQSALEQYFADQFYYPATLTFGSALSAGSRTYLNTIPTDPTGSPYPQYCYKPLKSTQTCSGITTPDCSNSGAPADRCVNYCLYTKLENQSGGSYSCGSISTYNFAVTPP